MLQSPSQPDRESLRFQLTKQEEYLIVVKIRRFVDQGRPLRRADVADAVELLVEIFPKNGQDRMRFNENCPGPKWLKMFL